MIFGFYRFSITLIGALLLHSAASSANTQTNIPDDFLAEAKKLYAVEIDYFQKRLASDWHGIHDHHHPLFKKNISIEEFKFFQGRVVYNYRERERQHVSGLRIPSMEQIKKNPVKKDILGFPLPLKFRKFQMFGDPLITIKSLSIGKISISKDKRFAKVESKIMGKQTLNPVIAHGDVRFPVKIPVVDYWEKVEGRWVITLLKDTTPISGVSKFYWIPNNNDGWKQMEFVDIDASLAVPNER